MSKVSPTARRKPPQGAAPRFLHIGVMLVRVYIGYRRIWRGERSKGAEWGAQRRKEHHAWTAEQFYATAIRLQGLLIKAGQFLSTRQDIMPREYLAVLSRLQDQVPAQPFHIIRARVEQELGRPLGDVFAEFEETPIASASLAQVHRARLHDGRVAAVKVQYPGIDKVVRIDVRNVRFFVKLLARLEPTLDFRFVANEIGNNAPQELDFINEGRNAERMRANFAHDPEVTVPEIYWEYTTRRVLVMEFIDGVKITDKETLREWGVTGIDVHTILMRAFLTQMLRHGFFHADPHPGNLLVQQGPKLAIIDFGLARELPPDFGQLLIDFNRAMLSGDAEMLGNSFRDMGFRTKGGSDESYSALGATSLTAMEQAQEMRTSRKNEREMMAQSRESMAEMRRNPIVAIPSELLLVGRVSGLLEGLGAMLGWKGTLMQAIDAFAPAGDDDAPAA